MVYHIFAGVNWVHQFYARWKLPADSNLFIYVNIYSSVSIMEFEH